MEQTKLYILTGFLGSGKTTVLLKLIERLKGKKIGVIQNEFGKLSIDGEILRNDDIQMVEITRGSIFCSCLKLNFVNALSEMVKNDFEYLFVESSGWGDPSNVQEILDAARVAVGKDDAFDFRGVICFVDAVNFLNQIAEEESANRQMKHCNLAVITKVDISNEEQIAKVSEKVREINPNCDILRSAMGDMDYSFMEKDLLVNGIVEREESTNSPENKPKSVFMEYSGDVDKEKMHAFLSEVAPAVHRVKGFCNISGSGFNQVDVVGPVIDFKPCEDFPISQLVFISKIGPAAIKSIMNAWNEHVGSEMKLKN